MGRRLRRISVRYLSPESSRVRFVLYCLHVSKIDSRTSGDPTAKILDVGLERFGCGARWIVAPQAVDESFAQSILWAGKIEAESEGRLLVDATDFLLRDAHEVAGRLKRTQQNDFQLDTAGHLQDREVA